MDGFSRLTFYDITDKGFKWIGEWVDPTEKVTFPFIVEEKEKTLSGVTIAEELQI